MMLYRMILKEWIHYVRINELGGNGDAAMFADATDALPKDISNVFVGGLQRKWIATSYYTNCFNWKIRKILLLIHDKY